MNKDLKLIAFDLDGTLTQHRTLLCEEHRSILQRLQSQYSLIMVGAGMCDRIFRQLGEFPIDIIGNYGMQWAKYSEKTCELEMVYDFVVPCDKELCENRIKYLREKYGFTHYHGESVEFHKSGCVTFPILGTKAKIEDKLAFDPDRSRRRAFYQEVVELFPEYNVFIGGSSSFDMAPKPYDKYHALDCYCTENGIAHSEVLYMGDDYGIGGNDEAVYLSDFAFAKVDHYTQFPQLIKEFLGI